MGVKETKANMDNLLEELGCERVDREGFRGEVFCFVCLCFAWF